MRENTRDFAAFGWRERDIARKLLEAWNDCGLPEGFEDEGVTIEFNPNSGYVFLTIEEGQAAMLNGDGELEIWHITPYACHEGLLSDLVEEYEADSKDWHEDDVQYLRDNGAAV